MDDAEKTWREAKLEEALYRAKESSDREYKLRQALMFYARPSNWEALPVQMSLVREDGGERARKALGG
jgi:hypothetical protein